YLKCMTAIQNVLENGKVDSMSVGNALQMTSLAGATTMTTSIGELPRTELSRGLVYVTGITCGVLAAIAAEILMRSTGVEIADTWRSVASTQGLEIRSVSAFWLMDGSSFV